MKNYGVVKFVDTFERKSYGKNTFVIYVGEDRFNALKGSYCRYMKIKEVEGNPLYKITFKLNGKRYRFCSLIRDAECITPEELPKELQYLCVEYLIFKDIEELKL